MDIFAKSGYLKKMLFTMFKNIQIFQKINIFQILKKKYPHFEETLVFIQLGSRW